ncbi:MAG: PfkB family carbohydrate kinase [Acidobacteriota bacterium]
MIRPADFPWDRLRSAHPRLLVLGDLMLDRTVQGDAHRLSPEAPVPVIRQRECRQSPGGAANVAANLAGLGARVTLFGVVGADAEGEDLRAALDAGGVSCDGVIVLPGRHTTLKTRVVTRRQQVVRFDREVRTPLTAAGARALLSRLGTAMSGCDGVLVPDYGKGVVSRAVWDEIVARAARASIPIVVDPDPQASLDRYRGVRGIKLNWPEARHAARVDGPAATDIDVAGQHVLHATGAHWAVITRGDEGLSVFRPAEPRADVPARRREVFDVTGAGDTVLAMLGFSRAAGLELLPAAQIANLAGGLAVERLGTSRVSLEEIEHDARPETVLTRKIVERDEMARRIARRRKSGERVVFTNGCFDLLHAGHIHLLKYCASYGSVVVVGLNSDRSVRELKGDGRPFLPLEERAMILGALPEVTLVVPFDEPTPERLVAALRPDILVKGADYRVEDVVGRQLVEAAGGRVVLAPLLPNISSSEIARRIRASGERDDAADASSRSQ